MDKITFPTIFTRVGVPRPMAANGASATSTSATTVSTRPLLADAVYRYFTEGRAPLWFGFPRREDRLPTLAQLFINWLAQLVFPNPPRCLLCSWRPHLASPSSWRRPLPHRTRPLDLQIFSSVSLPSPSPSPAATPSTSPQCLVCSGMPGSLPLLRALPPSRHPRLLPLRLPLLHLWPRPPGRLGLPESAKDHRLRSNPDFRLPNGPLLNPNFSWHPVGRTIS